MVLLPGSTAVTVNSNSPSRTGVPMPAAVFPLAEVVAPPPEEPASFEDDPPAVLLMTKITMMMTTNAPSAVKNLWSLRLRAVRVRDT